MTDQELNEKIAVKRGWIYRPYEVLGSMYEPSVLWYHPKTNASLYSHAPAYCNDWRWAGELLDDLIQKMHLFKIVVFLDEIDNHESEIFIKDDVYLTLTWHKSDNKCRKIAEAWYEVNK